jgi:ankyrin repeat protein
LAASRADALRYNFISCLILTAQNGFGQDVDHLAALCRETWGEEQWWDAVKDLPHGRVRREGPAAMNDDAPFGFDRGPSSAGRTHLMYAAQAGDVARLTWLLARGARLELKDWKGRTALWWACWAGKWASTARELIARGAAEETTAQDGTTLLHVASGQGDLEVVRGLLARGTTVDAAAQYGATPLFAAGGQGHLEVVRELLARGATVDAAAQYGATPLFAASERGHLEVVRELLARGATVNAEARDDTTPLFAASMEGHLGVVRELLANRASVFTQNIHGATALFPACFSGHVEVVRALLARGAADEGALNIACRENQSEVVQVLLQWSLVKSLQTACQFGHADLVRMLLARGASPSAPGPFGWTPLHYARKHPEVAAVLRAAGAMV